MRLSGSYGVTDFFDKWYEDMNILIGICQKEADVMWSNDAHWNSDDFAVSTLWDKATAEQVKANLEKLFKVFADSESRLVEFATTEQSPSGTKQFPSREEIVQQEMRMKLGLWLCSYFQGLPRLDLWSDIASLALHVGGYPAGAFYLKLTGDAFRFERRQWDKKLFAGQFTDMEAYVKERKEKDFDWEKEGILTMSYTPLLLVPDNIATEPPPETPKSADMPLESKKKANYKRAVEKLALVYARIQQRLYIRKGYPLLYAVSHGSACQALYQTFPPYKTGNEAYEREKRVTESEEALKKYFPNGAADLKPWQKIVVFSNKATRRRGLTSCVLATQDGVFANRPNRPVKSPGLQHALCYWTEGMLLDTDRAKLVDMWNEYDREMADKNTQKKYEGYKKDPNKVKSEENVYFSYSFFDDKFTKAWYSDAIAQKLDDEGKAQTPNPQSPQTNSWLRRLLYLISGNSSAQNRL